MWSVRRRKKPAFVSSPYQPGNYAATSPCEISPTPHAYPSVSLAARRALAAFRPDVVLSTGGFVSVPAVVAARGIAPVLTHEQTAILGLANRINARFADVLAVSHRQTEQLAGRLHRHVVVTGNPIRVGLTTGDRSRGLQRLGFDPAIPVAYVTGGARGASPINQRIAALLPDILDHTQIVHQTGPLTANADAVNLTELRETLPEPLRRRYAVVEFLRDELPDVYAAADLVIGRAGAGTIAELAYVGLPAILVPLPGARGDEQALNARVLGDAGAAVVIPQPDATPERLQKEILALLGDPERRSRMAIAARTVARPDAAARLADELLSLAAKERPRQGDVMPTSIASATVSARMTFSPATSVVPRRADDAGITALSKPRRCASPSRRST